MPAVRPTQRMSSTLGRPLRRHRRLGPDRLELAGALEQAFVAIEVERREAGGARERMRRIGIAVKQLDHVRQARA